MDFIRLLGTLKPRKAKLCNFYNKSKNILKKIIRTRITSNLFTKFSHKITSIFLMKTEIFLETKN